MRDARLKRSFAPSGFSLIEVLIALGVIGAVATIGAAAWRGGIRGFQTLRSVARVNADLDLAAALLGRDLRSAGLGADGTGLGLVGRIDRPSAFSRLDMLTAAAGDWSTISYRVETDAATGRPALWRVDMGPGRTGRRVLVLDDIALFRVRYFDGAWREEWNWNAAADAPYAGIRGVPTWVVIDLSAADGAVKRTVLVPVMTSLLNGLIDG